MEIEKNNTIPFISEDFTEIIKDLKIFIHNNIYTDNVAMNTLKNIIQNYKYNSPIKSIDLKMDRQYKTIIIETDDPIDCCMVDYFGIISSCFQILFSDVYVQELLKPCENKYKYALTDIKFLRLFFNITKTSDNIITVFL